LKLGIPLLVIGVLLLLFSIPYSIIMIVGGMAQTTQGILSGGIMAYSPLALVILGFILTTIGASRVFKD
jgi:hypothetical protein